MYGTMHIVSQPKKRIHNETTSSILEAPNGKQVHTIMDWRIQEGVG